MFKFAPDKFVIHTDYSNKKPHYLKKVAGFVIGGDGSAALAHPWASLHLCFLHINLTRYADPHPNRFHK